MLSATFLQHNQIELSNQSVSLAGATGNKQDTTRDAIGTGKLECHFSHRVFRYATVLLYKICTLFTESGQGRNVGKLLKGSVGFATKEGLCRIFVGGDGAKSYVSHPKDS
eukprot:6213199-Pleurochrysis_carterae.AAC.3